MLLKGINVITETIESGSHSTDRLISVLVRDICFTGHNLSLTVG